MCVVSMVMDHYTDLWQPRTIPHYVPQSTPYHAPVYTPTITDPLKPEEVEDLRKLLDRAKKYDGKDAPAEKKQKLKEVAELLGVRIDFL